MSLVSTTKYISVPFIFTADSKRLDIDAIATKARTMAEVEDARIREDQDTLAPDVFAFLLDNPDVKNIARTDLQLHVHTRRAEDGKFAGKSRTEKDAAFERLGEILPEFIAAHPDMFYASQGRKGVLVHYVPGEVVTDDDGAPVLVDGEPQQAYRWTDEEWKTLTAKKEEEAVPESAKAKAA